MMMMGMKITRLETMMMTVTKMTYLQRKTMARRGTMMIMTVWKITFLQRKTTARQS
jgi:hypothetical protein